jgi:hypothetical protein
MGLLSCQRISRVLTRIGGRDFVSGMEGKDVEEAAQAESPSFELKHSWPPATITEGTVLREAWPNSLLR